MYDLPAADMDFVNFIMPQSLQFNEAIDMVSFTVDIIDDPDLEGTEYFLSELQTNDPAVNLHPRQANITIWDDGKS